jgi:peptidoglycan/xylan/chitin deacetylase (PgdA/CDA1 family)
MRLREYEPPKLQDHELEMFTFLSWGEVRSLHKMGFDIGSHTIGHPILSRMGTAELDGELSNSKSIIEKETAAECMCIAYPNGTPADYSDTVVQSARRAGYKIGFTLAPRYCSRADDVLQLGRFCMPGNLSASEFHGKVSGTTNFGRFLVGTTTPSQDYLSPLQ